MTPLDISSPAHRGGLLGADNVGVLIAEEPYNQDEKVLIIDIGTNGELPHGQPGQRSVPRPAPPAPASRARRSSSHARRARRHRDGRDRPEDTRAAATRSSAGDWHTHIEKVDGQGSLAFRPSSRSSPRCFMAGIVDKSGQVVMDLGTNRVRKDADGKPEYVLAWASETSIGQDITITQGDVRALQLAKGALYTGAKLMMKRLGFTTLDRVILAGAFGVISTARRP